MRPAADEVGAELEIGRPVERFLAGMDQGFVEIKDEQLAGVTHRKADPYRPIASSSDFAFSAMAPSTCDMLCDGLA